MIGLLIFFACVRKDVIAEFRTKFAVLAVYCIGIAFFSPSVLYYNILAFLIVPMFAQQRRHIVPIYVFAMFTLAPVISNIAIGGVYIVGMHSVIALTLGAALMAAVKGGGPNAGWSGAGICVFVIFLVYVWPGARSTSATNIARLLIENGLTMLVPYYVVRRCARTMDEIKLVMVGLVAAAAALSMLALYEAWSTWPLYRVIFDHYGIPMTSGLSVKLRGGMLRSPGPFPEPTSFAFWLSLAALAGVMSPWMFRSRAAHVALSALLIVGMTAPQSRGAWLGLAAGFIIYQAMTGKLAALAKGAVIVAVSGVLIYGAALSIPRVGNMVGLNSAGVIGPDYRQILLDRGVEEAKKNIWVGEEMSQVQYNLRDLYQGEGMIDFVNTYLYVLLLTGLIGLVPFVIAITWPIVDLWRMRPRLGPGGVGQIAFVGGALGSMVLMLIFTGLLGRSTMILCMMLALAATMSRMRAPVAVERRPRSPRVSIIGKRAAVPAE